MAEWKFLKKHKPDSPGNDWMIGLDSSDWTYENPIY
jgi:hypothetical protein